MNVKRRATLPDGWAKMPTIPVTKGPEETLNQRQADALLEFLEGRLCDSEGKFAADYTEGKRNWLRLRMEALRKPSC